MKKWLKWIGLSLLIIIAILLGLLHYATYQFEKLTKEHIAEIKAFHQGRQIDFSKEEKIPFHLQNGNCESGTSLIFIHGTPGSFDNYMPYLENETFKSKYCMYAYERPGFGMSKSSGAVPKITGQLDYLEALIYSNDLDSIWIMGHSYGGSIALQYAIENPDKCSGLILIASPADPQHEQYIWLRKLIDLPLISWLLPYSMRNSNRELIELKRETAKQSDKLRMIRVPVLILHGTDDRLVPFENAIYLEKNLTGSEKVLVRSYEDMGHFILWQNSEDIMELIDTFIHR
jgi:pimeloyl-ACP methyl ester carboxylesterase